MVGRPSGAQTPLSMKVKTFGDRDAARSDSAGTIADVEVEMGDAHEQ